MSCEIVNVRHPKRSVKVASALVDSGSEFSWVPEEELKKAGVTVVKKDVPFLMANGQQSLGESAMQS